MKLVSYGRIRLDKDESEIRFSNDGQRDGADLPERHLCR